MFIDESHRYFAVPQQTQQSSPTLLQQQFQQQLTADATTTFHSPIHTYPIQYTRLSTILQDASPPQPELSYQLDVGVDITTLDHISAKKIPGKHCNACHQVFFSKHNDIC